MRPPVAHTERTLRSTCGRLERLLAGPMGGRTIVGCRCGSAGPRLAALCADRGVAFRGVPCGAPGAARRGATDGARGAASRAARGAADGPPTAHRRNGRVAVPGPDLGWASGGVATRSVERGPLEFVAFGEVATRGPEGLRRAGTTEFMAATRGVRAAGAARRPPPRRSRRRRRAARRDAAVWPASPPRRRPRRRRADARWPARWSPASVARSAASLPGGRGITRWATRQASRPPSSGAPDRPRTGCLREISPGAGACELRAAGRTSHRRLARNLSLELVLAAVRLADGVPATGARV